MLIVDFSQIMISTLFATLGGHNDVEIEENLLRHMVLNTLRANLVKFKEYHGPGTSGVVIACDGRNYWRKEVFPYYKANRKDSRKKSEIDWDAVFTSLNNIKLELKTYFPYRVISVDRAEADDIIGVLVREYGTVMANGEPLLILSGDKDFVQLHSYGNVKQYSPTKKQYIRTNNADDALREQIIRGDSSDGIPNFLSDGDTFVTSKRQKPIMSKKVKEWLKVDSYWDICETPEQRENWTRNSQLINLLHTPEDIVIETMKQFEEQAGKPTNNIFNYFIKKRLRNLMSSIQDFT